MSVALDSNILLYVAGLKHVPADVPKVERARVLVDALLGRIELILPFQVLGETYNVLIRKGHKAPDAARKIIDDWRGTARCEPTSPTAFENGFDLAVRHGFQIWDALIMAVAAEAGCELLVSEDMQNGFTWRGLTIADPFAAEPHPRLAALLAN